MGTFSAVSFNNSETQESMFFLETSVGTMRVVGTEFGFSLQSYVLFALNELEIILQVYSIARSIQYYYKYTVLLEVIQFTLDKLFVVLSTTSFH